MGVRFNVSNNFGEFAFYQVPKALYDNEEYSNMSLGAKVLYMLFYDRNKLSCNNNNMIDEKGDIFIYYPIEEIEKKLNMSKPKVIKLKKELASYGLIEEVRQGLKLANRIYVCKLNFQNFTSGSKEILLQEVKKIDSINNEENNNENNNIISMVEATKERVDYKAILEKYNSIEGNRVSKCKSITPERKKHLNARIKEYGIEGVYKVIDNINSSNFLKNKFGLNTKDKKKKLSIDWIINPNNFVKILEGSYTDTTSKQPKASYNANNMLG